MCSSCNYITDIDYWALEKIDDKINLSVIIFLDNKKEYNQQYKGGDFFDENTRKNINFSDLKMKKITLYL